MKKLATFFKTRTNWQWLTALCALGVTLGVVAFVYSLEYTIAITDDTALAQSIDDYFSNREVPAIILNRQTVDNVMAVHFQREGQVGVHGLAVLERGLFGKYRFSHASLGNNPLYSCEYLEDAGYWAVYGLYDLPEVESYSGYSLEGNLLLEGTAGKAPYLQLIPGEPGMVWLDGMHYFGQDGVALDEQALLQQFPVPTNGGGGGVYSESVGGVYGMLATIGLFGLAIAGRCLTWRKGQDTL